MGEDDIGRLRLAWEAYGRGDLDALVDVLDPEVRWFGADDPSAGCQTREAVLQFIRQAHAAGVGVELLDLQPISGKVLAVLQRRHPPEWGEPPGPHGEIFSLRNGKVSEIVSYPTVQEALDALAALGEAGRGR